MKEKIIESLGLTRPEFDFTESESFIEDGMLDSFDIVNLISYLDDAFNISIDGDEIVPENFMSILTIENMLKKYVEL